MSVWIDEIIGEKQELLDKLAITGYLDVVELTGRMLIDSLKQGNKIMIAGNGGSAADAQHFTGEIIGRFLKERGPLPCITLTVDPTVMTCLGNDYGYDYAVARQVEGLGREGDVFIAISTSGNSANMVRAIEAAKKKNIRVVGLLGKNGGVMKDLCDYALIVPSERTPRIQEVHTFTVHLLCEMIEKEMFD